jgi:hypothetical protein
MLQSLRSHGRLLSTILALVAAAAVLLSLPIPSQATTKTGNEFLCYSDPAHTHLIGYHFYCINHSGGWGTLGGYCISHPYPC